MHPMLTKTHKFHAVTMHKLRIRAEDSLPMDKSLPMTAAASPRSAE